MDLAEFKGLGKVVGGETVAGMYFMKEESVFK